MHRIILCAALVWGVIAFTYVFWVSPLPMKVAAASKNAGDELTWPRDPGGKSEAGAD